MRGLAIRAAFGLSAIATFTTFAMVAVLLVSSGACTTYSAEESDSASADGSSMADGSTNPSSDGSMEGSSNNDDDGSGPSPSDAGADVAGSALAVFDFNNGTSCDPWIVNTIDSTATIVPAAMMGNACRVCSQLAGGPRTYVYVAGVGLGQYRVSLRLRDDTYGAGDVSLEMRYVNAAGTTIGPNMELKPSTTMWKDMIVVGEAPFAPTQIAIVVSAYSNAGCILIDDVIVTHEKK